MSSSLTLVSVKDGEVHLQIKEMPDVSIAVTSKQCTVQYRPKGRDVQYVMTAFGKFEVRINEEGDISIPKILVKLIEKFIEMVTKPLAVDADEIMASVVKYGKSNIEVEAVEHLAVQDIYACQSLPGGVFVGKGGGLCLKGRDRCIRIRSAYSGIQIIEAELFMGATEIEAELFLEATEIEAELFMGATKDVSVFFGYTSRCRGDARAPISLVSYGEGYNSAVGLSRDQLECLIEALSFIF